MPSRNPAGLATALALATCLAGSPARAGEPAAGLRLGAEPAELLLGQDLGARLTIQTEPGAAQLRLSASVGTIEGLAQVGPGRFEARYLAPKQRLPQLAIVAATARGAAGPLHGWMVLPLWGQGVAQVDTVPGRPVTLRVGSRTFGPVTADEQGQAQVPISVPPGVGEVYFGKQRIDLGLPPLSRVQAISARGALPCDREESVPVRIYVLDAQVRPRVGARIDLKADRGSLGALEPVEPGVYEVRWSFAPGAPGEATLRGEVRDQGGSSFRLKLGLEPGPCERFALEVEPQRLAAAEGAQAKARVEARDRAGNPTRCALRLLEGERQVELVETAPGSFAAALPIDPRLEGRSGLELRLLAGDGSAPVAQARVELVPGEPATLTLRPPAWPVTVFEGGQVEFRAELSDRFGNPILEPPEVVKASDPVAAVTPAGPGRFLVHLAPGHVGSARRATLELRAGGHSASAEVELLPEARRVALLGHLGALTNARDFTAPAAGLGLEIGPGPLGGRLELDYLHHQGTAAVTAGSLESSDQLLVLGLGLSGRLRFLERGRAWACAGPAAALLRTSSALGSAPPLREGAALLAGQAALGAGYRVGPGMPFLELRGLWVPMKGLHGVEGNLVAAGLSVGYRVDVW